MVAVTPDSVRERINVSVATPYVETAAVMARYNPFFERAGLRKIAESPPVKAALNIAEVLKSLSFNLTFLRGSKYVLKKIASLNHQELSMLREAFTKNKHP